MSYLQEEFNEESENQVINEEYKIWKKNVPFLYDLVITHELDWPSLTVQWLPKKDIPPDSDYAIHKLIIGTHTSEKEPNYLMIAKVRLPVEDTVTNLSEYNQNNKGSLLLKLYLINEKLLDIGGLGLATGENKIDIETKILHQGEINRARYMPQKFNVIATKTISGEVHIFDYTQHPTKPENDIVKPQLRLTGHTKEGYALSWNKNKAGYLLSGAYDNKVILWDIEAATEINSSISPYEEFTYHKAFVEDVCWHNFHPDIFGVASDDRTVTLWDIKQKTNTPTHIIKAHSQEINSLDFSQFNEYLFLTGSADRTIALWDLRQTAKRLHSFEGHTDDVQKVEWGAHNVGVFASCSVDRRIIVWDLSKIGEEQKAEDAQDGPPEMLFIHGGHRAKIPDFNWNPNDNLVIASVEEENNFLQIWQMAYNIYQDDTNSMEEEKNEEKKK